MSVVIETTLGDITVDLFLYDRPRACLNFLKLCKIKYYNYNLFHTISRGFIAQTGDPTGTRSGGESIFGVIDGPSKKYFEAENEPRIKHTRPGLISFVGGEKSMIASQFFLTLGEDLTYLDENHCVFGEVVEGLDILESINEVICDNDDRPFQDVRITHTVVLDDPYPDPKGLRVPSRSPSPSAERLAGGRIAPDEEVDETSGKSAKEIAEMQAEREAKARATILEMVGDIPDAEMAPPENVLFVCKLNPVTDDADLEIIFSRFGKIKSCEVIRDKKTGDSLQYAFIEFEDQKACEEAYFKMDNVLVDDRRLHVDFSQSVSKVKWLGKGRGVKHLDEKGNNDIGKGNYKVKNGSRHKNNSSKSPRRNKERSYSPKRPERSNRNTKNNRSRSRSPSQSPERSTRRTRSPQRNRRQSKSPRRIRRSQDRREIRRRQSLSPEFSPRRNDRVRRGSRSPRSNRNAPRRSGGRYSPGQRSNFRRQRSRSPRRNSRSPRQYRREALTRRKSRSPRRISYSSEDTSMSPTRRLPEDRSRKSRERPELMKTEKNMSKEKHVEKEGTSRSPMRSRLSRKRSNSRMEDGVEKKLIKSSRDGSQSLNRNDNRSKQDISKSSRKNLEKDTKTAEKIRSIEVDKEPRSNNIEKRSNDHKEKTKNKSKIKKSSKSLKKKKKTKKYDSSDESDSEEDKRKTKKKKSKKKVESSTDDSSSSYESSSSSEEEVIKKKKRKKNSKVKKQKKTKKRTKSSSSSSSDSSSDSGSDSESSSSSSDSSSESERDNNKKKRLKKKSTKDRSYSD